MSMENIPQKVIVHCSDSKDTDDETVNYSVDACRHDHIANRGWPDIGYHYYITRDGVTHRGRDERLLGAHCKGQNKGSIAICLEGRFLPTVGQIKAVCDLYRTIKARWGICWQLWYGHREFDAGKACSGFTPADLRGILSKLC